MAAWSQVWPSLRRDIYTLGPTAAHAGTRQGSGPCDVAADGHAGLAVQGNTSNLAPLSFETRVLTLDVADMERKVFLKMQ